MGDERYKLKGDTLTDLEDGGKIYEIVELPSGLLILVEVEGE